MRRPPGSLGGVPLGDVLAGPEAGPVDAPADQHVNASTRQPADAPTKGRGSYTRRTDGAELRKVTVYLPVHLARALLLRAAAEDRPVSSVASDALAGYLADDEQRRGGEFREFRERVEARSGPPSEPTPTLLGYLAPGDVVTVQADAIGWTERLCVVVGIGYGVTSLLFTLRTLPGAHLPGGV